IGGEPIGIAQPPDRTPVDSGRNPSYHVTTGGDGLRQACAPDRVPAQRVRLWSVSRAEKLDCLANIPLGHNRDRKIMSLLHRIIHRVALPLATFGLDRDDRPTDDSLLDSSILRCQAINHPRVFELGTKRSIAPRSTLHDASLPNASENLATDTKTAPEADLVADAH